MNLFVSPSASNRTTSSIANPSLQHMPSSLSSQDYLESNGERDSHDPEEPITQCCPFLLCKRQYTAQQTRALKHHLRTVRGGGYDDVHPANHPEWKRLDETGFLKVQSRPKDLDPAVKEQRRAEAQIRYYSKHKDRILEHSRQRRDRLKSTISAAQQYVRAIDSHMEAQAALMRNLYGPQENYAIERFIDVKSKPTIETFARMVAYFLVQDSLPDPLQATPDLRMFETIPGSSQYRKVSALLHPDKGPEHESLQSLLNSAFDLWRPILEDPELKDVLFHGHEKEDADAFIAKGDKYATLSHMYFVYMTAIHDAVVLLSPTTLSVWGLNNQLCIVAKGVEISKTTEANEELKAVLASNNVVVNTDGLNPTKKKGKKVPAPGRRATPTVISSLPTPIPPTVNREETIDPVIRVTRSRRGKK